MVAVPRESIVSVTIPAEHRPADPIKRPVLAGTVLGSSAALIDEELHLYGVGAQSAAGRDYRHSIHFLSSRRRI